MHDVEIDPIRGELFQAAIAGLEDMAPRKSGLSDGLSRAEAHFRRDDHILAPRPQELAQVSFGFAAGVAIGRIEKIDARIESAIDHGFCGIEVHLSDAG